MDTRNEFRKNMRECLEYDWIKRVLDTAIVDGDIEFMKSFNKRVRRFRYLFIDNE